MKSAPLYRLRASALVIVTAMLTAQFSCGEESPESSSGVDSTSDTEDCDTDGVDIEEGPKGEGTRGQRINRRRFADQLGDLGEARRVAPNADVWVDAKKKHVIMDAEVCLREGPLEMFCCLRGTKEHESIVTVRTEAKLVHAALLALGAKSGSPAQFTPAYAPARGTKVAIFVEWLEKDGKRRKVRAQEWIRNVHTQKLMEYDWVFAGSGFWTDEETGKEYYQAEGGDFICVSNFPSALLDLPVESTQANQGLLFEAFTEKIPPQGTKVRLTLVPQIEKKQTEKKKTAELP